MCTRILRGLCALTLIFGLFVVNAAQPAQAQNPTERVWIQIESYASLGNTEARLRAYTPQFENVNGFNAGAFYAITLGPYTRAEAQRVLADLLSNGQVPSDSFIQPRAAYTSQFFPIGEDRLDGTFSGIPTAEPQDIAEEPAGTDAQAEVESPDPAAEELTEAQAALADAEEPVAAADETVGAPEEATDTTGADVAETAAQSEAEGADTEVVAEELAAENSAEPAPETVVVREETPQEARQSEALLTRDQRDELQIAMQYFGFYRGGIDGAFGPGTRGAMADWQIANGLEATGVLTTGQRTQLLDSYNAALARLGYEVVIDQTAGIQVELPLGMVAFDSYNFPFARYEPINDSGLSILLISQAGDRATLFGLYEIMQTLEIVPLEGERERRGDSFLLTGRSAELRSHTEARVTGGAVKGYTVLWGPERDEDMQEILPRLRDSIRYISGALDPAFVPEDANEDIDLVSGFQVRRPEILRSGFFVDGGGAVVTTAEAVRVDGVMCDRVLIDNAYPATVTLVDDQFGLAVLRPEQALAPLAFARVASGPVGVRGDVAVAGFPFEGALSYASTTFGTVAALSGVDGETWMQRLDVRTADSEAGAPVLGPSGDVVGMVLPGNAGQRMLPDEVTLALTAERLAAALTEAGVAQPIELTGGSSLNRDQLARLGADIAVRVSCWN